MNPLTQSRAGAAIKRATDSKGDGYSNVPVYANVLIAGEKIGHIVSDGYSNDSWSFYPTEVKGRRERLDKPFFEVLPKWASKAQIGEFETSVEMTKRYDVKREKHEREELLAGQIYKAIDSGSFPCNPIPFAVSLAEHVRVFGTDSIKTDDAKRILWILMTQAYGQLATIDLSDEWGRLCKS